MAKLIRAVAWRKLERPYTRKSKYRKKAFIKAPPVNKIVKFEMGDVSGEYQFSCQLKSKQDIQIRHNALESARKSSNRLMEKRLGRTGYRFRIRTYPHHVLRNNPLAAGAGADRMSTGMKMSFGKTVGLAARVKTGQIIMEIMVNKGNISLAQNALKRAQHKMPCGCTIDVVDQTKE
ncbi:MAG: 50S ribosomal protein L16 [Nanoarchaeota archaeon]|nr:50S ribosomal protein L16 [Nanoarchaeota archaeon]